MAANERFGSAVEGGEGPDRYFNKKNASNEAAKLEKDGFEVKHKNSTTRIHAPVAQW